MSRILAVSFIIASAAAVVPEAFVSGFTHILSYGIDHILFLPALFAFNMGIEAGQLVVVGIAYGLVAVWWKRENYRRMIARPASLLIAICGLCWAALKIAG